MWKNYFCKLLNSRVVNDIRQTKIYTTEPFVPERRAFGPESRKMVEPEGTGQIPVKAIHIWGMKLSSEKHIFVLHVKPTFNSLTPSGKKHFSKQR